MAALGLVRMLHPDALTAEELLAGLQAELLALALRTPVARLRRLDGLSKVTAALLDAIGLSPDLTTADDTIADPLHPSTSEPAWSPRTSQQAAPSVC
jgi:hypothetical protein